MGRISVYLPSFSSDYTGVASVLFEYGGLIVIHNAACCSRNFSKYDEPRSVKGRWPVYCSGLREMEAILGDESILIGKIDKALESVRPNFIAILGTPVPMLVGTDMDGIAREVEDQTGITTLGFNSTGFKYYNNGASKALIQLVKRFSDDSVEMEKNHVNIVGMTPLDYTGNENILDICEFLEKNGLIINASLSMETGLEQVKNIKKAAVNIVVSQMGLDVAIMMQEKWGIPYIVSPFIGREYSVELLKNITEVMESRESKVMHTKSCDEGDTLIIHDQVIANGMRNNLGMKGTKSTVGTFFGLDSRLSQPGDLDIDSEKRLIEILKSKKYKTIYADPLVCELAEKIGEFKLFPIPHYSVSAKLYVEEYIRFLRIE